MDEEVELTAEQQFRKDCVTIAARYHSGVTSYLHSTLLLQTAEEVGLYIKHGPHTTI